MYVDVRTPEEFAEDALEEARRQAEAAELLALGRLELEETAALVVETAMSSTSPAVTIEFQGGEPLAAFPRVQQITDLAIARARELGKTLDLSLVTSLTLMDEEKARFLLDRRAAIYGLTVDGERAARVEQVRHVGDRERGADVVGVGAHEVGERGLGADELTDLDGFRLDAVPHAWLFPRCSLIVHHGGGGTTGAGVRSGVPSMAVPYGADQPFWGRRLHALGVGPAPIPYGKVTAEKLAAAIREQGDEAAVIGVPDDYWGESVKAFVVLKQGMKVTEDEIIDLCKKTIAGYKKPRSVEFVQQLPKSPTGKILKRVIKSQYRHQP